MQPIEVNVANVEARLAAAWATSCKPDTDVRLISSETWGADGEPKPLTWRQMLPYAARVLENGVPQRPWRPATAIGLVREGERNTAILHTKAALPKGSIFTNPSRSGEFFKVMGYDANGMIYRQASQSEIAADAAARAKRP